MRHAALVLVLAAALGCSGGPSEEDLQRCEMIGQAFCETQSLCNLDRPVAACRATWTEKRCASPEELSARDATACSEWWPLQRFDCASWTWTEETALSCAAIVSMIVFE